MIAEAVTWAWSALQAPVMEAAGEVAKRGISEGSEAAVEKATAGWKKFNWNTAEQKYRQKLLELVRSTRVLGYSKLIDIDQIYTDVFVLDKLSAQRRYTESLDEDEFDVRSGLESRTRLSAKNVVHSHRRLFILGRPGAGKTTFLKHLAMNACKGLETETPVFVSLKDWSDGSKTLLKYLVEQFSICDFPNPELFVLSILETGRAHILLDGLDEVNEWQDKRSQIIREIVKFSNKYGLCRFSLTCRTAATDYSFERFEYVEIADFTSEQQLQFAKNWYGKSSSELSLFLRAWEDEKSAGFRDLGRTPLLLTLLCLAFDENHAFPKRQVDVYQEAIYALLKKWDSSRLITRDNFYRDLSPIQRTQLLETVAAQFYFSSKTVFRKQEVAAQIVKFVESLPDITGECDGAEVVRQIEAQHGLLVERAKDIFTFSHLTIQEYFSAAYISKNQNSSLQRQIIKSALSDQKWREVILYTVALLPNADSFFEEMLRQLLVLKQSNMGAFIFLGHCFCVANVRQHSAAPLDAESVNIKWLDVWRNASIYARAIRMNTADSAGRKTASAFLNNRWLNIDTTQITGSADVDLFVLQTDNVSSTKLDLDVIDQFVSAHPETYSGLNDDLGLALRSYTESVKKILPWAELRLKIDSHVANVRQPPLSSSELEKFKEHVGVLHDFLILRMNNSSYSQAYMVVGAAVELLKKEPLDVGRLLGGYFARNEDFVHFFYACRLLMECLEIANTSRRARYLSDVLTLTSAEVSKIAAAVEASIK